MKNLTKSLLRLMLFLSALAASNVFAEDTEQPLKYVNALEFRMINQITEETKTPYTRIPKYLEDSVRHDLWQRSQCSSGLGIRFSSDSKRIGVKYKLLWDTHMFHMADTGLKGTDLYVLTDDGRWEYVNTNRPVADKKTKECTKTYVNNMDGRMHEYLIYLPLYDGVTEMWVGVDSASVIQQPVLDTPRKSKKVVMYGTSILQGGCSTRTGMVATNMIQRDLNCEVVNWGFSGEGKMDFCMARALAKVEDADVYVLDPVPNCTEMMCDTITYDFVKTLADLRPDVPIVMVEGPIYSYAKYDSFFKEYLPKKNAKFRKNYEKLVADGYKNLYYLPCDGLSGYDNEGTVDGIHFTDLGFRRYADKLIPILKPLLDK